MANMRKNSEAAKDNDRSVRLKLAKELSPAKDISLLMTSFLMKIVGLWLAEDKKEQRRRNLMLVYTVLAILFGVWVQFRDFYYSWPNVADCTYTACNILCLIMVLLKLLVIFIHKDQFMVLLAYTYKYYWHTNYDYNELLLLKDCRRLSTLCLTMINLCVQGTVISYVLTPIVANIGRNHSDRVLPFNMWVDLPLSVSPWYEIVFVLQIAADVTSSILGDFLFAQVLSLYHVAICYICFDNVLCLINLHAATQFRMIQHRLISLGGTNEGQLDEYTKGTARSLYMNRMYTFFKSCVQRHQAQISYCQRLNNIFTIIVFGHILVLSILICLVGFQILLAESSATRRLIFVFNITGNICQLLLFTYSCDSLIEQSTKIGYAIFSGPWTHLPMDRVGRTLRKDLRMVIIRSRKSCCLTAAGFSVVSLETCTAVLSTAISYFTLLRQFFNN